MPADPISGFLEVSGGKIYFERAGSGPAIFFVHAAIADSRMWEREFRALSEGHTVVRYDVRGLGKSPPATAPYSNLEDLLALLKHLETGPAVIVGCSNGGRMAIDFTLTNPSQVRGLLLVAPGLTGWRPVHSPEIDEILKEGQKVSDRATVAWAQGRKDEALDILRNFWCPAVEGENLELVKRMMKDNEVEILTDASALHDEGISPPSAGRLGFIMAPTVVLYGDRDAPAARYLAESVASGIRGARLNMIPGADHLVNLSKPGAFDVALRSLL